MIWHKIFYSTQNFRFDTQFSNRHIFFWFGTEFSIRHNFEFTLNFLIWHYILQLTKIRSTPRDDTWLDKNWDFVNFWIYQNLHKFFAWPIRCECLNVRIVKLSGCQGNYLFVSDFMNIIIRLQFMNTLSDLLIRNFRLR